MAMLSVVDEVTAQCQWTVGRQCEMGVMLSTLSLGLVKLVISIAKILKKDET